MAITFHKADSPFKLAGSRAISKWLDAIIAKDGYTTGNITFVFCSDEYLLDINGKYLNHNYLTDIITFDYTEGKKLSAEMYISIDRVKENAKKLNLSFKDELHRVMVHGLLHCMGYSDKTADSQVVMQRQEDNCLSLRSFLN